MGEAWADGALERLVAAVGGAVDLRLCFRWWANFCTLFEGMLPSLPRSVDGDTSRLAAFSSGIFGRHDGGGSGGVIYGGDCV